LATDHLRTLLEAAVALHRAGKLDEAAVNYREVLAEDATQADALSLLGQIVYQQGDSAAALNLMTQAYRLRRDSPTIVFNLARLYLELRDWKNAAEVNQDAARLAPDHPAPHCNLGLALVHMGRAAEGEAAIRKSLALAPDNALSWSALGLALARQNRTVDARAAFEKAVRRDPALAEARFNLSELLLTEMDFAQGWPLFAARADADRASFTSGGTVRADIPGWRGEDITEKTILVWGEQGLGDQILFAGLVPDLCKRARQVVLACDPRLVSLLARSFPAVKVVAQDGSASVRADRQIALGALGQHLRPDKTSFAGQSAYLRAAPERVGMLKARYRALGALPVIGVSWRSSRRDIGGAKSISVQQCVQMLRGVRATYVSLQYGDVSEDLVRLRELGVMLHHDTDIDPMWDVDGQAAQIAALDLVVSVSNTTVHVAGGLGAAVWTLAPVGAGRMWYWFQPQEPYKPGLWYPTMRIHHQHVPGAWPPVVERVRNALISRFGA